MDIEQVTFKDLVDLNELKLLFEKFSAATGFTTGLIDHATNEVLLATGWRDICAKFHRACPKSQVHCKTSNKELTSGLNHIGEIRIHHCENGLVDGCTPIIIQGKHFANLFTGQILFAPPDREQFRIQAQQYGYDEQAYLASLAEVPVISEEKFTAMLQYLAQTASMIVQMGLANFNSKEESTSKEAFLQSVFRSAPVGIGVVVDRVFTWTNDRLSEITGYSSAELEGQAARMLYPSEEEFAWVGQEKYVQIKKYGTGSVDTRFKRKDGSIINVHLCSTPIDQQDLTAGVTFTALDITERKQAEEALHESEQRYRSLFCNTHTVMLVINPDDGAIVDANPAAESYYGWSINDLKRKNISDINTLTRAQVNAEMELARSEKRNHFVFRHRRAHGEARDVEVYSGPIQMGEKALLYSIVIDITPRKQAEFDLLEAQRIAHFGSWSWDIPTDIITWSSETYRIYGMPPDSSPLKYEELMARIHPDDREYHNRHVAQWLENKGGPPYEYRVCHPDGSIHYIFAVGNVTCDGDGKPLRMFGVVQDITERKEADEALRKNEKQLQKLLQSIQVGVVVHGPDTKIIRCNQASQELLGLTEKQMLGKEVIDPAWKFCREDGSGMPLADYPVNQVVKTKNLLKNFVVGTYKPNTRDVIWVLVNAVPAFDSDGNVSQIIVTFVDITERKEAEAQLVKAKKEWEHTFDAIADIITIQDKDMNIVRANKAAHDFFQANHGELNGKRCYELFTGASEPCSECPLLSTLEDMGKHSIIIRHENLDKFFHVSSSPVLAGNGDIQHLVHVAKDITEQKKQEKLAQQISSDQEQLKHFESLRTMAGAIAHRFNNAMMGVQGNLELMLMTLPGNVEGKEMASAALQAAKGASLVGSMMLTYLGQRSLHLEAASFSDLAGECATELKNQMGPSLSLKFISPPAPLYCSMDKQQIKEVITNILNNAIESLNNEAGEIEISFGTDHFDVDSFPVVFQDNDTKNGMYMFCQIRDTGQGITAENLQRLFEPFFTTKFVGRGLGLALGVGIMRSHHGAVLVESKSGAGTTVRMLLPVLEQSQKEITSPAGSKKDVVKLSGDILLVDDDDSIRNVGKRMLEVLGFTIHTAVNGLEAVEMVRRQDINYRAVVMDISMPVMDGIEAMQRIKKSNSGLPILLSSGYSEKDFSFEMDLATKPDGFLEKPFMLSELQHSLEKLLS